MEELATFLAPAARLDVKMLALQQVLGLSASPEGVSALSIPPLLSALAALLQDPLEPVAAEAHLVLVNLSSAPAPAAALLALAPPLVPALFATLRQRRCLKSKLAEKASMLLSNLTREAVAAREVHSQMVAAGIQVCEVVDLLCQEGEGSLPYLGPALSNLSQLTEVREELVREGSGLIQRLLPFTEYQGSAITRGGVVGCLRNCTFSLASHPWLIGPQVDLVPRLVLPLAGPTPEELTEEEVDSLPLDLQYLEEDKTVEEDEDIRTMLLESLTQLCATRQGREELRRRNIYLVLRQFHAQEKDGRVRLAAENLVDILIKTEQEIKVDNYKEVEVPQDMVPQLDKMDEPYLKS